LKAKTSEIEKPKLSEVKLTESKNEVPEIKMPG